MAAKVNGSVREVLNHNYGCYALIIAARLLRRCGYIVVELDLYEDSTEASTRKVTLKLR